MQLANLNLRAGEKAISLGTFLSAVAYLISGIDLEITQAVSKIIVSAKVIGHKLPAYLTLIKAVVAQKKVAEALQIALKILDELGEP
eukprot:1801876-Ditylum_brightwellii.AAC.1